MTSTIPNRTADLERRVAELEAELQRESTRTRDQAALYKIAALASSAEDMPSFYQGLHDILRGLMYAENMYVALYEDERQLISFPYFIDLVDKDVPDPRQWDRLGTGEASGVTGYILRKGELLHVSGRDIEDLAADEALDKVGAPSSDYLGVPLTVDGHTIGVLAVQSYEPGETYDQTDEKLLGFVADHIAAALARTRSGAQLRQRNAELAIVNEVGQALAKQLDLTAITELVGERLHETFPDTDLFVALYDAKTNLISFPYEISHGKRYHTDPIPADSGVTAKVIHSRAPLLVRTAEEAIAFGAILRISATMSQSWLGVPIIAGDELIGVLAVESETKPYAFDEDDARLLSTLGASTGVALRNARLFDETNRLLAESTQRNAELAVINEIGAALGKQLDFQSIVDAVGDRLAEVLDTGDLAIAIWDEPAGVITFPYSIEYGIRLHDTPPLEFGQGLTSKVLKSGRPLRLGTAKEAEALDVIWQGDVHESYLGVPILSGQRVIGVLAISKREAGAFSQADEQLVSTVASSMGVALENARLFDETNARAAELAIINSVQEGLAAHLDMQAMYDLVGNKIAEIFHSDVVDISVVDAAAGSVRLGFGLEKGERLPAVTIPLIGFRKRVYETKAPIVVNRDLIARAVEVGNPLAIQGETPKSVVFLPLFGGGEVTGVLSLQSIDREDAFSDAAVRLLGTLASSLSVALENARLFDETKRLLAETEQRNAELAVINEIGEALAKQLDFQAIVDAVGERIHGIFGVTTGGISLYDPATNMVSMPYSIDQGQRLPESPRPLGGLAGVVIERRSPLRLASNAEAEPFAPYVFGTDVAESWLGVPILAGARVLGVISLERNPKDAFSESDERLLATIAANLGVALENARLFDETKRLLGETNERAAELAIINSVQQGLAAKLDMQSMYDLVGAKIAEIFDADTLSILGFDVERDETTRHFLIEGGVREEQPITFTTSGLGRFLIEHGEPFLVNQDVFGWLEEHGITAYVTGEAPKSMIFSPLVTNGRVTGTLTLQNIVREDAFSERDLHLLTTLAASLSVALENARLFDETQRLLSETNERAAELAIINSVQEGLAAKLDMGSMYDLVGDKITEIFDVDGVDIERYDARTGIVTFEYTVERGERLPAEPMSLIGFRRQVVESRAAVLVNRDLPARAAEAGQPATIAGELAKSALFVPMITGGAVTGIVLIENLEHEDAFSERDVRLLTTLAGSLGVALENARLFDETQRLLAETNERAAELAIINSVQQGLAAKLDMASMYDLVGNKIQEIFDAQEVDITTYDREASLFRFVFGVERGVKYEDEPIQVIGFRRKVLETRQPLMVNRDVQQWSAELGQPWVISG